MEFIISLYCVKEIGKRVKDRFAFDALLGRLGVWIRR